MKSRALLAAGLAVVGLGVALAAFLAREPQRPYVITAIDYHFHDAHPTFPIEEGRDLVVKNAGRNPHNVTIPALDYSRRVAPGGQLVIANVGERFGAPGRYTLVCLLHQDRGMFGTIVVAAF